MLQNSHIHYIVNNHPDAQGNNTRLCFYFWKEVCEKRGIVFDDRLLSVMEDYKPESIVRKRRELYPPTPEQAREEEKMWQQYAN